MCFIEFINELNWRRNWIRFVIVCKLWLKFDRILTTEKTFEYMRCGGFCCLFISIFPNRRVRRIRMFIVHENENKWKPKCFSLMQKVTHKFVDVCVSFSPTKYIIDEIHLRIFILATISTQPYICHQFELSHQIHSYVNCKQSFDESNTYALFWCVKEQEKKQFHFHSRLSFSQFSQWKLFDVLEYVKVEFL